MDPGRPSSSPPHDFQMRIVNVDVALSPPTPGEDVEWCSLTGSPVKQVPVLRLFGSTPAGQKVAAHIHNVFPYFFVDLPQDEPEKYLTNDKVTAFIQRLAASIDRAMDLSFGNKLMNGQYVHDIHLVKGRPFYGYSFAEMFYFKIYMSDTSSLPFGPI